MTNLSNMFFAENLFILYNAWQINYVTIYYPFIMFIDIGVHIANALALHLHFYTSRIIAHAAMTIRVLIF